MMFPCKIGYVAVNMQQHDNLWALYYVSDPVSNTLLYIGCAELNNFSRLPDARMNTEFVKHTGPIEVSCTMLYDSEKEAISERRRLVELYRPHCNIKGYNVATKYQKVMCETTGEIFRNAAEAARMHQINSGNLSRHLRRDVGFKTISGRIYSYVIAAPQPVHSAQPLQQAAPVPPIPPHMR